MAVSALHRAQRFAAAHGLALPILLAPMAGACPVALSVAVAEAGGMGALGALLHDPAAIAQWVAEFRERSARPLQVNLWIPDPPAHRDAAHEAALRAFFARFGPSVPEDAGDARPLDFDAQCEAVLAARPRAVSSIMGLYPPSFVARCKAQGIRWFATVTTVAEARAAQAAGADVIVAQGVEAGGHRGSFDAGRARDRAVGLFALLPQVVDAVSVPVVAAGGIADGRGIAAALVLGASAVQIGTGLLRTPEAGLAASWAAELARTLPEGTVLTRAFSGRWGRTIETAYVRAAHAADAPEPAPYPVQRGLSAAMRQAAAKADDVQHMQAWAGQGSALALAEPAAVLARRWWQQAEELL